jgi:hypothetical protein
MQGGCLVDRELNLSIPSEEGCAKACLTAKAMTEWHPETLSRPEAMLVSDMGIE